MAQLERQRVLPFGIKLRPVVEIVTAAQPLRRIERDEYFYVSAGMLDEKRAYMGLCGFPGTIVEPGESIQTELKRRIGKTIITLRNI